MKTLISKALLMAIFSITAFGCSSDNNEMICPDGYSGPNCDVKITPTKIKIHKIVIKSFPVIQDNFDNWDEGEDNTLPFPDVFIAILNGSQLLYMPDNYYEDAMLGSNPTFEISPPIEINSVLSPYNFGLYDYDNTIEESVFMTGGEFRIYSQNHVGFPDVYTVTGNDLMVDFHLSYEW